MKKKQKNKLIMYVVIGIILLIGVYFGVVDKAELYEYLGIKTVGSSQGDTSYKNTNELYDVIRVVDGDTFVVNFNGKEEKVRLIGIDTPESVHKDANKNTKEGKSASTYTKELLEGKKVRLEFDVSSRDKYSRLLAYAYLEDEMVNKILLKEGYAKIATYPPNVKYVDEFKQIQEEARKNKKGFWNGVWE